MEIRLPVLVPTTPLPQTGTQTLKLGDILRAVVQAQVKDNAFLLRLDPGGRTLTANASANLKPGQRLELEVVRLGATPELRIVAQGSGAVEPESTVQQALRQFLPKQEPLAEAVQDLRLLVAQARQTSALPKPVKQALENLLASIPKKSELTTPEGVKAGLRNSGVFLEAKLARYADSPPDFADSDFKAQLLRVLDGLKALRARPDATLDPAGIGSAHAETSAEPMPVQPAIADAEAEAKIAAFRFEEAGTSEDKSPTDGQTAPSSGPGEKDLPREQAGRASQPRADDLPKLTGSPQSSSPRAGQTAPEAAELLPEDAVAPESRPPAGERTHPASEPRENDSAKSQAHPQPAAPEHEPSTARRAASVAPDERPLPAPENEFGAERIAQKVEAALARVVTDQLASLPGNDAAPSLWQLEIPFSEGSHQDAAKLLISKDGKPGGPETEDYWSLTLELHPPGLGTFCARIVLKGNRVDTYLWSDTAATSDLIREQCERLKARLHGAGLTVGQLTALDRPPRSPLSDTSSPPLLDLRA